MIIAIDPDSIITLIKFAIFYNKQKTEDIVQGLPKIEELLEAKKNSNSEIIKNAPNTILRKIFEKISTKTHNKRAVRKSIRQIQKILCMFMRDACIYSQKA